MCHSVAHYIATTYTTTIKYQGTQKADTTSGDNPAQQPYKMRQQQFYDARSFSISSISFALQKSFYLELVDDIGCIKHFSHIMKIRESKAFIH